MEVVPDVAGKRRYLVVFYEVFMADSARFLMSEFFWIVRNLGEALDHSLLEQAAFSLVQQCPTNNPSDAWAEEYKERNDTDYEEGCRDDYNDDRKVYEQSIRGVRLIAVLC